MKTTLFAKDLRAPVSDVSARFGKLFGRSRRVEDASRAPAATPDVAKRLDLRPSIFAEGLTKLKPRRAWGGQQTTSKVVKSTKSEANFPTEAARKRAVQDSIMNHAATVRTPDGVDSSLHVAQKAARRKGASELEVSHHRAMSGLVEKFKVSMAPLERGVAKIELAIAARESDLREKRREIEATIAPMLNERVEQKKAEISALRDIERNGASAKERFDASKKIQTKLRSLVAYEKGDIRKMEAGRIAKEIGLDAIKGEIERLKQEKEGLEDLIFQERLMLDSRMALAEADYFQQSEQSLRRG